MHSLIVADNLDDFFRHYICRAKEALKVDLSDSGEAYLVHLLCDFSSTEAAREQPAVASLYERAVRAPAPLQLECYKVVGDVSLYTAGFFGESVHEEVGLDYYVKMGEVAYETASSLVDSAEGGAPLASTYRELSQTFAALVDVLGQVSDETVAGSDPEGVHARLYARWARTRSERLGRLLYEKGLLTTLSFGSPGGDDVD